MNLVTFLLFSLWSGLMVFAGGLLLERAAAEGRLPLRWTWLAAVWLAALLPIAAVASPGEPDRDATAALVSGPGMTSGDRTASGEAADFAAGGAIQWFGWWTVPGEMLDAGARRMPAWEIGHGRAVWLWMGASLFLALLFAAAHLRLRARMRRWTRADRSGQPFLVSPAVGPATVGIVRPQVVLPRWAIQLPDDALRLILEHEREHIDARDNLTLWLGVLALVLCPWNPAVWMAARRLRLAVEMDCDARVLGRGASIADYGRVLLDVGSRGRLHLLTVAEMAVTPSFLERRLKIMKQRSGRMSPTRAVGLGLLGGALLLAACASDAPVATRTEDGVVPASATAAADPARPVIRIDAAGDIALNGEAVSLDGLGTAMAPYRDAEPGTITVLEASESAPYRAVAAVQRELRRAELLRVIFAAIGEDGEYLPTSTLDPEAAPGLGMVLPDTTMRTLPTTEQGLRNVLFLEARSGEDIDVGHGASSGRESIDVAGVQDVIAQSLQANPTLIVVLRTDPEADYGTMFRALDGIQSAGATRFSLQTLE